jgi:ankyrin repeat protein
MSFDSPLGPRCCRGSVASSPPPPPLPSHTVCVVQAEDTTPAAIAAGEGQVEVLHALLDAGANINHSSVRACCWRCPCPALPTPPPSPLTGAQHRMWCPPPSPDVGSRAQSVGTPLHVASLSGRIESVDALLARGAALHSTTKSGATPLHGAAEKNQEPVVRRLLAAGASIDEEQVGSRWGAGGGQVGVGGSLERAERHMHALGV